MGRSILVCLVVLAGCGRGEGAQVSAGEGGTAAGGKADLACLPEGERCRVDRDTCCPGVCVDGGYGWGHCSAPLPDGEWCWRDHECASRRCLENVCTPARCVGEGGRCVANAQCCAGTICDSLGYGFGTCRPPLGEGSACYEDADCASGRCDHDRGVCAAPCRSAGGTCETSADCCAGTFCSLLSYLQHTCEPLLPSGAFCLQDADCLSARCTDHECAPADASSLAHQRTPAPARAR